VHDATVYESPQKICGTKIHQNNNGYTEKRRGVRKDLHAHAFPYETHLRFLK
jgi:hypothetical protein